MQSDARWVCTHGRLGVDGSQVTGGRRLYRYMFSLKAVAESAISCSSVVHLLCPHTFTAGGQLGSAGYPNHFSERR